jgi:hypothetical protein
MLPAGSRQPAGRARLGARDDGYRLMVRRASPLVRLSTGRGFGLDRRYPANNRGCGKASGPVVHGSRRWCGAREHFARL